MLERILTLFWSFFKIGLFTFGGGHSMIPLITQEASAHGYLTFAEIIDMIAVSESTPGPFAINIATFIGKNHAGIAGSIMATLAVVLPSFLIIWGIAKSFDKIKANPVFQKTLHTILPVAIALVSTSGISILFYALCGIDFSLEALPQFFQAFDWRLFVIFIVLGIYTWIMKQKNKQSPIQTIILGACLGMIIFSIV